MVIPLGQMDGHMCQKKGIVFCEYAEWNYIERMRINNNGNIGIGLRVSS